MRFFLRSKQFKKTIAIVAIVLVVTLLAGLVGGLMAPQAGIIGSIVAPIQKLGSSVADAFEEFSKNFKSAAVLNAEKEKLQNEVNSLREQLVDYEEAVNQNEFYEKYLEIKELNPDFKFKSARVTSIDPDDIFKGFTVDAGKLNGVSVYDPVITDEGLVGYVSQISGTTAKITTILSPKLTCGAFDSRTSDAGVLSGDTELANKGFTRFYNLPRTCAVAVGDFVVTSGNGIFPDGLIIGTINNISNDSLTSSLFATVTPTVDFDNLKSVMIITSFTGQGNELIDGE